MRSCLSLAGKRSAANRAESAVHSSTTVGHTGVVARFPYDLERGCAKTSADRSTACAQVLAIATPANSRGDRRFCALPANRAAKTPACQCQLTLHGQRGLYRECRSLGHSAKKERWKPRGERRRTHVSSRIAFLTAASTTCRSSAVSRMMTSLGRRT